MKNERQIVCKCLKLLKSSTWCGCGNGEETIDDRIFVDNNYIILLV